MKGPLRLLQDFFGKRKAARLRRELQRYAAAQSNHLTGSWLPASLNVNDLINQSNPTIKPRMRQLVRDFPPFARAVNNLVQYVVGTGIQFQSRVVDGDNKPDQRSRTKIEDALKHWMDEADVSGSPAFKQHFYELMGLAKRQDAESGEFLCVFQRHQDQRNKFLPLGLAFYETDRLTDLGARPVPGNKLSSGVEYDGKSGAIVAFHLSTEDYGRTVRVPAEDTVFGFHRMRPGQVRGVTPFAPAVLLANDMASAMDSEVDAFKLASKWLAIVTTEDPAAFQAARLDASGAKTAMVSPIEYLENAIIEYLRPGEDIKFAGNQRGSEAFQHFSKFLLRLAGITVDLPYEIMSGDYEKMNFSTMRVSRNDFAQQLAPTQRRHVFQFCQPITYRFLDEAVLHGRLELPGYWRNPWHYRRGVFIPPGMKPVDPLRESKAAIEDIRAGLKSPQQVILERGGDPETVLDEVQAWKEMCKARGLEFDLGAISTTNANNPAAVAGEASGDSGKSLRVVK